jgi:hypothetical protein
MLGCLRWLGKATGRSRGRRRAWRGRRRNRRVPEVGQALERTCRVGGGHEGGKSHRVATPTPEEAGRGVRLRDEARCRGRRVGAVHGAVPANDARRRIYGRHRYLHHLERGGAGGGSGDHRLLHHRRYHGRFDRAVLRGARLDHPRLRLVLFLCLRHLGGDRGVRRGGVPGPGVWDLLGRRLCRMGTVPQRVLLRPIRLPSAGPHQLLAWGRRLL